jgi:hypothetical protein
MADPKRDRASLHEQEADQVRNLQRGGQGAIDERREPEANDTMAKVWSDPGGEANNFRNAMVGAGTKADDHSDLTAAQAPEAHKHLSDATLSPEDKDATAEAIARMTSGSAKDQKA